MEGHLIERTYGVFGCENIPLSGTYLKLSDAAMCSPAVPLYGIGTERHLPMRGFRGNFWRSVPQVGMEGTED